MTLASVTSFFVQMTDLFSYTDGVYNHGARLDVQHKSVFLPEAPGALNTIYLSHQKLWDLYKQLRSLDWDANEFSHERSKTEMTTASRSDVDKITKTLLWQWEADSTASRVIMDFLSAFNPGTELSALAQRISENEALHSHSYSEIVKNTYEIDSIIDLIHSDMNPVRRLNTVASVFSNCINVANRVRVGELDRNSLEAKSAILVFFGAMIILERIQFTASFNVTFTYGDRGSWNSIAKTVQKIATDELSIHVKSWKYCFANEAALPEYKAVLPEVMSTLEQVCSEVLKSELAFCDILFSDGQDIERAGKSAITCSILKESVRFEAQHVYQFFGFDLPFALIEKHPMPHTIQWKDINSTQTSPQEELTGNYLLGGFVSDLTPGAKYTPKFM